MATFLYRLGFGSYRHRAAVVGVWLLLLVAAGVGAATLSGKTVDTFRIPGQESTTALDVLGQKFGSGANGATAQVVLEGAGFVVPGDATIKPIASALALGILVDAVVVRMVIMPSALALLGARAWWLPRWLAWLPRVDVEGLALDRPAPEPEREPVSG
jgi:uncharacterized membrane protein YdfJ with MMPL/SSD domain